MSVSRNVLVFHDKEKNDETHPWKSPFLACIVGSIGQGKTNTVMNILDELNNHYNRIIVFSGNKMDTKLSILGDDVEVYGPNLEKLQDVLLGIIKQQKNFKKQKKKLPPILLIFDDLITDKSFFPSTAKGNDLIKFIISLRHYNTSVMITAQQYMAIPKKIRGNMTMLFTFKVNDADYKDMLKETNFDKNTFKKAFDEATKGKHNFLYVNMKTREMYRNFGELLNSPDD